MLTNRELIQKLETFPPDNEAIVVDNDLIGWEIINVEAGESTETWISLGRQISD